MNILVARESCLLILSRFDSLAYIKVLYEDKLWKVFFQTLLVNSRAFTSFCQRRKKSTSCGNSTRRNLFKLIIDDERTTSVASCHTKVSRLPKKSSLFEVCQLACTRRKSFPWEEMRMQNSMSFSFRNYFKFYQILKFSCFLLSI